MLQRGTLLVNALSGVVSVKDVYKEPTAYHLPIISMQFQFLVAFVAVCLTLTVSAAPVAENAAIARAPVRIVCQYEALCLPCAHNLGAHCGGSPRTRLRPVFLHLIEIPSRTYQNFTVSDFDFDITPFDLPHKHIHCGPFPRVLSFLSCSALHWTG
ncbi:hypothetical protein DFH07DRAFT_1065688 [Mycena maculata]|uniref:Uncharacterized protein n=1 Tax=Mycena maculata TaxID=230809 RepID=A0AAD7MTT8_9AGAR|nr:hypothetical protein DFH07DRAFT_1065688 [Mycena maculata]